MPFCRKCGEELLDNAAFCPDCGTLVSTSKDEEIMKINQSSSETRLANNILYGKDTDNLSVGYIIDNRYKVEERLGRGGFGTVYKALDQDMQIYKAIKVISREFYDDKEVISDLRSEAAKMNLVFDKNVVRFYDIHLKGDIKYFDMEYIDGGDLVDLKLSYPDKKVPEDKVIGLIEQIASGMIEVHKQHMIHKDLKPQNVMLTKDGIVKLMDFGISETFRSSMTRIKSSRQAGTPAYMSPEQLIGENVGKESDIWSFGVMIYEMLSGKQLYSGNTTNEVLMQIERKKFKPVENISEKINRLLEKCLQYEYDKRFRSFEEIVDYLSEKLPISIIEGRSEKEKWEKAGSIEGRSEIESLTEPISDDLSHRRKKIIPRMFFVFFILFTLAISTYLIITNQDSKVVSIPDLRGMTVSRTTALLDSLGLKVGEVSLVDDNQKIGIIISSSPSSGIIERGSSINLVVGKADRITIPDLRGMTRDTAFSTLNDLGLEIGQISERKDNKNIGRVISTSPASGEVNRGSSVDIVVGIADRVAVPNLIGLTLDQAKTGIINAGLLVGNISERKDNNNIGRVISTSPASGKVNRGSSVDIVVGIADRVTVPNLIGLTLDQAKTGIINTGLQVGNILERKDNNNIGKIVSISPSSGEVNRGSRVDIVIGVIGDYTSAMGIELIFVQGSTFQMGSTTGDSDEKPVHSVTLNDFYIGKYEVTQKQWRDVMGSNPSHFRGDNLPIENVNWYNAIEFCNKLSVREGLTPVYSINNNTSPSNWSSGTITANWNANGYRLPTEAEWEYAARGGNRSRGYTYSGSNNLDDVGWYGNNSGSKTHPVGSKRANELGIYDMSGNVWEWCWDWYGEYTATAKTNPVGPNGASRVFRGGCWFNLAFSCTVSYRGNFYAAGSDLTLGFRVSRVVP